MVTVMLHPCILCVALLMYRFGCGCNFVVECYGIV